MCFILDKIILAYSIYLTWRDGRLSWPRLPGNAWPGVRLPNQYTTEPPSDPRHVTNLDISSSGSLTGHRLASTSSPEGGVMSSGRPNTASSAVFAGVRQWRPQTMTIQRCWMSLTVHLTLVFHVFIAVAVMVFIKSVFVITITFGFSYSYSYSHR